MAAGQTSCHGDPEQAPDPHRADLGLRLQRQQLDQQRAGRHRGGAARVPDHPGRLCRRPDHDRTCSAIRWERPTRRTRPATSSPTMNGAYVVDQMGTGFIYTDANGKALDQVPGHGQVRRAGHSADRQRLGAAATAAAHVAAAPGTRPPPSKAP